MGTNPEVFCVTGDSPREMYNYIRIRPRVKGRYEFRFIPRPGSDIAINSDENADFIQLSAQAGVLGKDFQTAYGLFRVTTNGRFVKREQVMISSARWLPNQSKQLLNHQLTPPFPRQSRTISGGTPPVARDWYKNAFLTELLGSPFSQPVGRLGAATLVHYKPRSSSPDDDGYIKVRISATVNNASRTKALPATFGTTNNWSGNGSTIGFEVVQDCRNKGSVGCWRTLSQLRFQSLEEIPIAVTGITSVSAAFRVTSVRIQPGSTWQFARAF